MTRFAWCGLSLLLVACGGETTTDDGGTADGAVLLDGGAICAGAADGTACGAGMVCSAGACVAAGCGDGMVDDGEQCDDGNSVAFDGCEPDCTFTCEADAECDDGLSCNGAEICNTTMHACEAREGVDPGTACSTPMVPDGVCRVTTSGSTCVDAGCGNGVVDGTEDCDDMNETPGDGCEPDCRFTCTTDADCDDFLNCTGTETCDVGTHVCQGGTTLDCGDGDDCTDDLCDDTMGGCYNPLIDMDGDGHAATSLGACGTDCDDTRDDVFEGAEELCDGVDNNCNSDIDEIAPTWYIDCDADGFAGSTDSSRMSCAAPPGSATGCGGAWVSRRPVDRTNTDCDDSNPDMFPGQMTYFGSAHSSGASDDERWGNYNCNGTAEYDRTRTNGRSGSCTLTSRSFFTRSWACSGTGWTTSSTVGCGYTGAYTTCGAPAECTSGGLFCGRSGYSLVCAGRFMSVGDPCYCPRGTICSATCTPGSSGCAWHYYRCNAVSSTETLACH